MTLAEKYQDTLIKLISVVTVKEKEPIKNAAKVIAKAVENNKKVYLAGICHGTERDVIARGGGPAFYLSYEEEIINNGKSLKSGDIVIVGSVSGRTLEKCELVIEAKEKGAIVIGLSSVEYSKAVEPIHESGVKFYEMVDVLIDNHAPVAEAIVEDDRLNAKFGACSGILNDYILWTLTAEVVDSMIEDGCTPRIFKSNNYEDGVFYNIDNVCSHYEEYGY